MAYAIPLESCTEDVSQWFAVIHSDIVHFLVYTTSFITAEEMMAYKNLLSYDFFTSGWPATFLSFVLIVSCCITGPSLVLSAGSR